MTIAMNAKVHRYDATLALIKVIPIESEFLSEAMSELES